MSYCRWSPSSDVYVYESVSGGWQVNVAENRPVNTYPYPEFPQDWQLLDKDEIQRIVAAQKAWHESTTREPITLGGTDGLFSGPGEAADHLEHLRSLGYIVPQFAIDCLREEAAELNLD